MFPVDRAEIFRTASDRNVLSKVDFWPISAADQSRKAVGIFSSALHDFD
jgi:hypothetical protein